MPDKKELFTSPRWNDTSIPKVTGYRELTEEEKRQADIDMKEILVKQGIMKDTDDLKNIAKEIDFDNLDEYVKNNIRHH